MALLGHIKTYSSAAVLVRLLVLTAYFSFFVSFIFVSPGSRDGVEGISYAKVGGRRNGR